MDVVILEKLKTQSLAYESQTTLWHPHTKGVGTAFSSCPWFVLEDMVGFTCSNRDCGRSLGNAFEEKEVSTLKKWLKRESPLL